MKKLSRWALLLLWNWRDFSNLFHRFSLNIKMESEPLSESLFWIGFLLKFIYFLKEGNQKDFSELNLNHFLQTMSSYETDAMLESLSLKLRDAEVRRAEAERAHQVLKSFLFVSFLIHYKKLFKILNPVLVLSKQ